MPPISREVVLQAVETYGLAWTTQDPSLLSTLFTDDCIYVERAFDRNATFRGLDAIVQYWKYQICGKQSHIQFRHVASEMIRDADRPIAVVKWLAEFDNRREHRVGASSDKTYKRVRFCQLAKLVFQEEVDGNNGKFKISYLEEYGQSMTGPGNQWPGLFVSDEELMRRIRFDLSPSPSPSDDDPNHSIAPEPKMVAECNFCGAKFPSRTQLHRHLKSTEVTIGENGTPSSGSCVPLEQEDEDDTFLWISLSLGYTSHTNVESILRQALLAWHGEMMMVLQLEPEGTKSKNEKSPPHDIDLDSLTWAVPPEWSTSSVVNVASLKVRQSFFELQQQQQQGHESLSAPKDATILSSLNKYLETETATATASSSSSSDTSQILRIHTLEVVDRPCVQARREFEKYEAFIPWSLLVQGNLPHEETNDDEQKATTATTDADATTDATSTTTGWSRRKEYKTTNHDDDDRPPPPGRRPLEETKAGNFVDRAMTKRLRNATRLLRDGGRTDLGHFFDGPNPNDIKIRLRTCIMDAPWQRFCRISVSMRQPRAGYIEDILGILIRHARSNASDDELVAAALEFTNRQRGSSANDEEARRNHHSPVPSSFPMDFVCLLEPALSRYERKAKVRLCGSSEGISDDMRKSIDGMECSVLQHMESKLEELKRWVQDECDEDGATRL